jgi:D-alanyl-lipoteichoic acid acyltransferase DltB (MBOAT superfamily)
MLFNSLVFVVFFTLVYGLYRVSGHRTQGAILLVASYAFYGWWDWRFLSLIALSTGVDYAVGLALSDRERRRRGWILLISIVVNLGILATFKYLGFFLTEVNRLLAMLGVEGSYRVIELILPVGLSFYTFQSMGYSIDVYRGRIKACRDPLAFATFVAFFPQLVAGPIERSDRLIPQLQEPRRVTKRHMAEGSHLLLWGYYKKLYVADNLGVLVAAVFEGPVSPGGFAVLIGAYAFTWQIYCDFSGYSNIARGLSKWLGIDLVVNFRLPFFAASPSEVWRRWHISLSQWLRDYLYIPLGGSRKGELRTQLNLMTTMVLGGLWHGANWTFVAWGAYHGGALAVQRALPRIRVPRTLAIVLTFHFTVFGFLIFRAHDLSQVGQLVQAFLSNPLPQASDREAVVQLCTLLGVVGFIEWCQHRRGDDLDLLMRLPKPAQAALYAFLLFCILVLGATYGQRFIYFQF